MGWALRHIEFTLGLVNQWKERKDTLNCAIKHLDEVFGKKVIKYRIYGYLLNNLGVVCEHESRDEEAASFHKRAIDALKAATDCLSEGGRLESISHSQNDFEKLSRK